MFAIFLIGHKVGRRANINTALLNREDGRLQVVTVAEMFAPLNKRLDLPMARGDAVKSTAAVGDADRQGALL